MYGISGLHPEHTLPCDADDDDDGEDDDDDVACLR
jgi:hypothetical protein